MQDSAAYANHEPYPGVAVRLWQLGIEMRPLFGRDALWAYPLFASVGGSFGYWLQGVEQRQLKILTDRRDRLLEKRRRAAAREEVSRENIGNTGTPAQLAEDGTMPVMRPPHQHGV